MNLDPSPALEPGRRAYEQARKLMRAKRRRWARYVTVQRDAQILQFPTKEVSDDG